MAKVERVKDRSDSSPCLKATLGRIFSVLQFIKFVEILVLSIVLSVT